MLGFMKAVYDHFITVYGVIKMLYWKFMRIVPLYRLYRARREIVGLYVFAINRELGLKNNSSNT